MPAFRLEGPPPVTHSGGKAAIARSVRRGLRQQFLAGRFDAGVWAEIGAKVSHF